MESSDGDHSAFPTQQTSAMQYQHGMTLRDYFAGQYLAGIMACPISGAVGTASDVAFEAYDHADAMIRQRSR